jgi:hypothetical protein
MRCLQPWRRTGSIAVAVHEQARPVTRARSGTGRHPPAAAAALLQPPRRPGQQVSRDLQSSSQASVNPACPYAHAQHDVTQRDTRIDFITAPALALHSMRRITRVWRQNKKFCSAQ